MRVQHHEGNSQQLVWLLGPQAWLARPERHFPDPLSIRKTLSRVAGGLSGRRGRNAPYTLDHFYVWFYADILELMQPWLTQCLRSSCARRERERESLFSYRSYKHWAFPRICDYASRYLPQTLLYFLRTL